MLKLKIAAMIPIVMLSATAIAQTRFCVGGDLDHLSSVERASCNATMNAVRHAVSTIPAPADWHFVVVCGEEGWKQYTAFSTRDETVLSGAAADTDREQRTTYLREGSLHTPQPGGLKQVVAHEVASVLLNSHDEDAIQTQIAVWDRNNLTQQASLR